MENLHKIDMLVILSAFNGEDYICECLDSILKQSYQNFFLLIIDDCSTDQSWQIIQDFISKSGAAKHRLKTIKNPINLGLFRNINYALKNFLTPNIEYIKLFGQDDIMEVNCLEEIKRVLDLDTRIGSGWCYDIIIDELGREIQPWLYDSRIAHTQHILTPRDAILDMARWGCLSSNISNLFFRREVFKRVGYFREDIKSADFEFLSRAQLELNSIRFTKRLVRVRSHIRQWGRSKKDYDNFFLGNIEIFNGLIERNAALELVPADELRHHILERICRQELWWALKALGTSLSLTAFVSILRAVLKHFSCFVLVRHIIQRCIRISRNRLGMKDSDRKLN